jgi:hypothetical protein
VEITNRTIHAVSFQSSMAPPVIFVPSLSIQYCKLERLLGLLVNSNVVGQSAIGRFRAEASTGQLRPRAGERMENQGCLRDHRTSVRMTGTSSRPCTRMSSTTYPAVRSMIATTTRAIAATPWLRCRK